MKLSHFILSLFLILPLSAQALSLGKINPQSSLNQPFKAEIPLNSVTQEELSGLKVGLASKEIFARAGVERSFILSSLTFEKKLKADGRVVILVASRKPISEPFLNFLIEVNGPQDRVVREYSVLLDLN